MTSHGQRTDSALPSCSIGSCFAFLVCCIACITGLDPSDHSDPIDSIALLALTARLLNCIDCIDCIRHGTVTLPCFDRPLRVLCIVDGQPQSIHPNTPQVRGHSVGACAHHCITIKLAAIKPLEAFTARPHSAPSSRHHSETPQSPGRTCNLKGTRECGGSSIGRKTRP